MTVSTDIANSIVKPVLKSKAGAARDSAPEALRREDEVLQGHRRLRSLRAVILLKGTVRRTVFNDAIDRSILELPLDSSRIVLDAWRDQIAALSKSLGLERLPGRILIGRTTRLPAARIRDREVGLRVEIDPVELRGTGGVLHDVSEEYDGDDLLLVANAAQLLIEPLSEIVPQIAARGGDVTVVANADGTPASLALVSCRAIRHLPAIGFIDFKEQGLPLIARRYEVRVLTRPSPVGLPIRTPRDYLAALMSYHRQLAEQTPREPALSERGHRRFSIVEPGASVAPDAILHNAVVLGGGHVSPGAVVADSIVCGGGVIRRREHVVRQLVCAAERIHLEPEPR